MAHELSFENGKAQTFSVRETPWHKEGTILTGHPSYEDALTHAGFDYPLEKRNHFRILPDGSQVQAEDSFYVYRADKGLILGSVGSNYEVVTNREAFAPLQPLVDTGILKLETGGVLRDGADAWLLGRWDLEQFGPTVREVFGNEILPYATVCANHNGRRQILMGNTAIRIVCANTLGQAETDGRSRWVQIAHNSQAKSRLIEAAQSIFSGVVERYEVIAAQYRKLMQCALTHEQFAALVLDVIAPRPEDSATFNPDAKLAECVVERNRRKRDRLTHLWTDGKGHTGELNSWFAYNAAVECLDFDKELFPSRNGTYRTASMLDGQLARMKNNVLDGLVTFAQSV